ncbi:MAG: Cna protein B-type domain containing protein [Gammaproteobacteria bacterium]|nr:Cna protein B-type domain containing protein [Gammaproteobacteria bacterium]
MIHCCFENPLFRRLLALAGLLLLATPLHAATARGTVFHDENENGNLDAGEAPVPGVRVSNGLDIVLTDAAGRYELPVEGDTVLFVVKPPGYGLPVNASQLPQFFYIHKPTGSPPNLRYPGIAPTGPLPETINFPLLANGELSQFEAILFADPQPQTEVELGYIRDDVVSEVIGTKAKFGMTLGDILFDDLSFFNRYNRIVAQVGIPWFNVPGNHELNFDVDSDEDSLATFIRVYGPRYYSFEYGEVVFIVLDNVVYQGSVEPTPENPSGRGTYVGRLDDRQMGWLRNEVAHIPKDKLVFLAMHIPLMSASGPANGIHTQNGGELLGLLTDHPHVYSVAGHMHSGEHVYLDEAGVMAEDGRFHHHILSTVSGSWWSGPFDERGIPTSVQSDGTPNGYHVLEIDGTEPRVRYQAAGAPATHQMRISFDSAFHGDNPNGLRDFRHGELFDGRMTESQSASTWVIINLYDGGPKSTVSMRVDGGDDIELVRTPGPAPAVQELQNRFSAEMKSWVTLYPSQHLWKGRLPALGAGTYRLQVRATDEFNRVHTSFKILEITTD